MPLNIDLNTPCIDHESMECNIDPSIDLNYPSMTLSTPSSSTVNLFPIALNEYSTNKEEEFCENELELEDEVLSMEDIDIDDDNHYASEVLPIEQEVHLYPNGNDGEANNDDSMSDGEYLATLTNFVQHERLTSKKRRSFLNNEDRKIISRLLVKDSFGGKLKPGTTTWLASIFSVSTPVIFRIWRQVRQTGDATHKKTKNCGQKRIAIDIQKVCDVPLAKRNTLRSLAFALGISKTALLKFVKEGTLPRHSNALKPYLKDDNMKDHLRFCLSMLKETSIPHDPVFKYMYNVVHIDEKWFYITKKSSNYYLLENEDEPYRTCKNKNFIGKVMFLVTVARARFDHERKETFSRKIGMFPLVHKVAAKRSSVNRASGTLETKSITSITKEVSRRFLKDKVLPAIKEKWPREHAMETIYIQQDNAPCHVSIDDEEFSKAASEGGFDIRLTCQPPNSPDLNVLDLGFLVPFNRYSRRKWLNQSMS